MSFQSARFFGPTGDEVLDVMLGGVSWDVAETRTLSWAVANGFDGFEWQDISFAVAQFEEAIDTFARFIDVEFDYLGTFDNPIEAGDAGADIVYSVDNSFSRDGTLAYAYFPGRDTIAFDRNPNEGGDVFLNFSSRIIAESTFEPGSDGFLTIIHELGHALGLKHPFEAQGRFPSMDEVSRDDIRDVDWFSIMSYTDPFDAELNRWDPATPMLLDVLALQYLYGANPQTHAGDDVHALLDVPYYQTIWDAGGSDTLDVSGLSEGWYMSLPDVQKTPLVDVRTGFALPRDQYTAPLVESVPTQFVWLFGDIENALGSDLNDVLIGTGLDNDLYAGRGADTLEGQAGDDLLNGGDGVDTAVFSGSPHTYTITFSPDGTQITDRVADRDGTDRLVSIEALIFGERPDATEFDLVQFAAPTDIANEDLEAIIELYVAYFNRAPDAQGLWFWANAFQDGATLEDLARLFVDQHETRELYAETQGNTAFATMVYQNVLGRSPDDAGLKFWVGVLDTGAVSRDQFILEVLRGAKAAPAAEAGPEFINQQRLDRAHLDNKVDLGALYAVHFGLTNVRNATDAIDLYDGTAAGMEAAITAIEEYHFAALDPDDGEFMMPLTGVLPQPFADMA